MVGTVYTVIKAFCILAAIIAYGVFFASRISKRNIVEIVIFSLTSTVLTYACVSAFLLVFDVFSIFTASILTGVVAIGAMSYNLIKKLKPSADFNVKGYVIPIVIALIMAPFALMMPHEYFGMGQDEGVYQTEAIFYARGINNKQVDFREASFVEDAYVRGNFLGGLKTDDKFLGYIHYNSTNMMTVLTGQMHEGVSEWSMIFHGLHTYSALLGLWSTFFGIENMMNFNFFLAVLVIFWIHMITGRLKLKDSARAASALIFALSPLVIWLSKSTLCELIITVVWMVFIYNILGKSRSEMILASFCLGIYGLVHISGYIAAPFFLAMFFLLCLYTGNREYAKGLIISGISYFVSFWIAFYNSTDYTLINYVKISGDKYNVSHVLIFVFGITAVMIITGVVLLLIKKQLKVTFNTKVIAWLVRIGLVGLVAFIVYRILIDRPATIYAGRLTILALMFMTGVVVAVILFFSMFFFTDKWTDNKEHLILLLFFGYFIVGYTMFAYTQVKHMYYYGRYLTMYIAMIAIISSVMLDRMKPKLMYPAIVLSVAFMLPLDWFHLTHRDDTRVQWDTLNEIEETVKFNGVDCVVLRYEIYDLLYSDLKSIGVDTYPIMEDYERELTELDKYYKNVVILDYQGKTGVEGFEDDPEKYTVIRRIFNLDTQDQAPLGGQASHYKFIDVPYDTTYNSQTLTIYDYQDIYDPAF